MAIQKSVYKKKLKHLFILGLFKKSLFINLKLFNFPCQTKNVMNYLFKDKRLVTYKIMHTHK